MAVFAALFVMRGVQLRLLRYWLTPDSFVIERGLLFRKRRVISRARIQAVDLERGLLHRALGLTEVRVEALGGGDTEGALPGVPPEMAARLREELVDRDPARSAVRNLAHDAGRIGAPDAAGIVAHTPEVGERGTSERETRPGAYPPEPPPLVHLPGAEVVVAGLTESRLGAGVAAAWVGLEAVRQGAFSGWFGTPEDWAPILESLPWVAVLVILGVLVLLFSLLLSFVLTVLGYWGFTLRLRGDVLEVERGLLTQHRDTVPLDRIQAVRIEENPFRRLMGLASVKVVVAGRARSSTGSGTNVLLPVGPRGRAFELAARVAGWNHIPPLHPMPTQARARRRLRAGIAAGLAGLAAPSFLHPAAIGAAGVGGLLPWNWTGGMFLTAGAVALGVGLVALLLAEGAWRGLGWAEDESHAAFREGILERRTTLVPLSRLQSVDVVSTPFQRRRGLATLTVQVARPALESDPRAVDLDEEVARNLRTRLLKGVRQARRGAPAEGVQGEARGFGPGLSAGAASGMFTR